MSRPTDRRPSDAGAWDRRVALFNQALSKGPLGRAHFFEELSKIDAGLAADVASLVTHYRKDFLEQSPPLSEVDLSALANAFDAEHRQRPRKKSGGW